MSEQDKKNSGQFEKGNEVGKKTRFKKKNTVAVKYKDEFCDMLINYFQERESQVIYEEEYHKDGTLKRKTPKIVLPPKYPTFERFAVTIGVTSRTLREWADSGKHPRFSYAYARAKDMQLAIAKNCGITKQYDGNFAKFVLMNDHDMTDKSTVENTQDKPFEVNINVVKKQS